MKKENRRREWESVEKERQDGSDNNNNRRNGDTKVGLTLRVVVAVYVLYLAYGLIQGFGETSGNDRIFIAIAIIVFVAAGGAILFFSGRKLIRKEYVDADEGTESEVQNEVEKGEGAAGGDEADEAAENEER